MGNEPKSHYWKELFAEIWRRFRVPLEHPTFIGYFVLIVMGIGAFGLIEPSVRYWVFGTIKREDYMNTFSSSIYTYFTAIASTAVIDVVISSHERKSLMMFFLFFGAAVFFCALLSAGMPNKSILSWPSAIGYVLALLLWWLANADNAHLQDKPTPPATTTGGDTETNLSGDTAGFKV